MVCKNTLWFGEVIENGGVVLSKMNFSIPTMTGHQIAEMKNYLVHQMQYIFLP